MTSNFPSFFVIHQGQQMTLQEFCIDEEFTSELHAIAEASIELGQFFRSGALFITDIRKKNVLFFVYNRLIVGVCLADSNVKIEYYCILLGIHESWNSYLTDPLKIIDPNNYIDSKKLEVYTEDYSYRVQASIFHWITKTYANTNLYYHRSQSLIFIDKGKRKMDTFERALNEFLHLSEFTHAAIYVRFWEFSSIPQIQEISKFFQYVATFGKTDPELFSPIYFPSQAVLIAENFPEKMNLNNLPDLVKRKEENEYYIIPKHAPTLVKKINLPPPSHRCPVTFFEMKINKTNNNKKIFEFKEKKFD